MLFSSLIFIWMALPIIGGGSLLLPGPLTKCLTAAYQSAALRMGRGQLFLNPFTELTGNYLIGLRLPNRRWLRVGIALPLGISYLVDVQRGTVAPQCNISRLGLFISLFPQLIAGPIVRYHELNEQIDSRFPSWQKSSRGLQRLIIGLAKKSADRQSSNLECASGLVEQ